MVAVPSADLPDRRQDRAGPVPIAGAGPFFIL